MKKNQELDKSQTEFPDQDLKKTQSATLERKVKSSTLVSQKQYPDIDPTFHSQNRGDLPPFDHKLEESNSKLAESNSKLEESNSKNSHIADMKFSKILNSTEGIKEEETPKKGSKKEENEQIGK